MTPDMTREEIEAVADCPWSYASGDITDTFTQLLRQLDAALEPIAPPDVAQAARVLLDAFNTDAVDQGCDAAQDEHAEGNAGEANDIVEAFLRAIAGETP